MSINHNHGTDRRYSDGCRCDECREAHKIRAREYRDRKRRGLTRPALLTAVMSMEREQVGLGPVESAVELELDGLAAEAERPGWLRRHWLWRGSWMVRR